MRILETCPVCHGSERTTTVEYNGLVLLEKLRESPLARYDYALCHACGVVGAGIRPEGDEYAFLVEHFDENLGRSGSKADKIAPMPEDPAARAVQLAALRADPGAELDEMPAHPPWASTPWYDRRSSAPHFRFLAASLSLQRGQRVLELRSKSGWLLDSLREAFGCEVYAVPGFDHHRTLISSLFQIPAEGDANAERLEIPYDGRFDLIMAKHMFTHAVFPADLLMTLRERLSPEGALYLHLENDDKSMWERRKNLIGEMKCFHMQNFDPPSLERALACHGFRVDSLRHVSKSTMAVLARPDPTVAFEPMAKRERRKRLAVYRRWRDESVLALRPHHQRPWKGELREIRRRALARGDAVRERHGLRRRVRPRRKMALTHEAGFDVLNERQARPR